MTGAPLALLEAPPGTTSAPIAPRRPREDALPEQLLQVGRYRDQGCDLFAFCLTCPLPHCRYDVAGGARTMLNRVRDDEIRRLRLDSGMAVDEIARHFRVSRRTVFRVLQHASHTGGRHNGNSKAGNPRAGNSRAGNSSSNADTNGASA